MPMPIPIPIPAIRFVKGYHFRSRTYISLFFSNGPKIFDHSFVQIFRLSFAPSPLSYFFHISLYFSRNDHLPPSFLRTLLFSFPLLFALSPLSSPQTTCEHACPHPHDVPSFISFSSFDSFFSLRFLPLPTLSLFFLRLSRMSAFFSYIHPIPLSSRL